MATTTSIDQKETTSLIGSDKVDGTAVYGPDRGKIGSIERVMIDKLSGLPTPCWASAVFWVWVKNTIPCRGPHWFTTQTWVAIE